MLLFKLDAQIVKFNRSYIPIGNDASGIWNVRLFNNKYNLIGLSTYNYPQSILMFNIDLLGEINGVKIFGDTNIVSFCGVEESVLFNNNKSYLISLYKDYSNNSTINCINFYCLSDTDTVFTRCTYSDTLPCEVFDNIYLNNYIYSVGLKGFNGSSSDYYDVIVIKYDTLGNKIWMRNYGGTNMDWGWKILKTYDEKMIIASKRCGYYTSNNPWYNNDCQWWVFKVDTAGNMIWNRNYGNPDIRDGRPFGLTETSDSCYIITGSLAIEMPDASERLRGRILKIDRNGNIVWDRLYGHKTLETYASIIKKKSNSNLISLIHDGIPNYGYFMVIQELTPNGDIKWFRKYKYSPDPYGYSILNSFDFTPDGGYIFAGYGTDTDSVPSQRSWVIKTDSLGFDGTYWQGDSTLGVSISKDTVCYSDSVLVYFHITGKSAPYSLQLSNGNHRDSIFYSPYFEPYAYDSLYIYPADSNQYHNITATVTDPWGNAVTENISVYVKSCGTGTEEINTKGDEYFEVYPNPAYSSLFIELTENKLLNNEIQIIDIKGNSILSVTLKHKKESIDISTLPKGVYFVKLGEQVERFVKE
ncbi:MAG: hypothetical protein Kow0068_26240 [Marinilabiliales bacterium]